MEWGHAGAQAWILAGFGAAAAAVFAYLARDAILRRRTDYDEQELESQRDRDREKYESDWGGDGPPEPDPWPYRVLGLEPGAPPERVRERYRELARHNHPDKDGSEGAAERMARINAAYEELGG